MLVGIDECPTKSTMIAAAFWHCGHDGRCCPTRFNRFCGGTIWPGQNGRSAYDQAGDEHVVRLAEADRCRRLNLEGRCSPKFVWAAIAGMRRPALGDMMHSVI